MNQDASPGGRPGTRRYFRFRNEEKNAAPRRLRRALVRWGLPAGAAALLLVFVSGAVRSARTRQENETYVRWRTEAETVAENRGERETGGFRRMTLPDGTPVSREYKENAGLTAASSSRETAFHRASGEMLPGMEALRRKNRDLAAWLTIGGVLDLPVVYRDNTWYLNHNFEGEKSASGTLFLDEGYALTERAQTLLIHGHNMKDGSMFGLLTHYLQEDFRKKHQVIRLTTLWEKETYLIFAAVITPVDPREPGYLNFFSGPSFSSESECGAYLTRIRERSAFPSALSVRPSDALLELSTCVGENRLILFARRIRDSETAMAADAGP